MSSDAIKKLTSTLDRFSGRLPIDWKFDRNEDMKELDLFTLLTDPAHEERLIQQVRKVQQERTALQAEFDAEPQTIRDAVEKYHWLIPRVRGLRKIK